MRKAFMMAVLFFSGMGWMAPYSGGAQGREVIEQLPSGLINWTQAVVTAKGNGAPPTDVRVPAQARLMAERAAKADGLRNLLETVKGVRVDAKTTVETFTTKSDVVMTRVSGIVKGARVVATRYLSDGGVEVTVEVKLTGELLAVMLQELPPLAVPVMPSPSIPSVPKPSLPPPALPKEPSPTPPAPPPVQPTKVPPPSVPVQETKVPPPPAPAEPQTPPPGPAIQAKADGQLDLKKLEYTGLIIDGRKLNLRPALIPKVLNEKGELVYSQASIEQKDIIRMGLVGYAKDVDAAAKNQRVTADPIVVTGLQAAGDKMTDVVISNRDAQVILTTAPYTGYLKNGRVMVVYQ